MLIDQLEIPRYQELENTEIFKALFGEPGWLGVGRFH